MIDYVALAKLLPRDRVLELGDKHIRAILDSLKDKTLVVVEEVGQGMFYQRTYFGDGRQPGPCDAWFHANSESHDEDFVYANRVEGLVFISTLTGFMPSHTLLMVEELAPPLERLAQAAE